MKNRNLKNKEITGLGLLIAIEAILCFLTNYVSVGSVNINLALIPIVIASFAYGPLGGLIIGLENGVITLMAPATLTLFIPVNPIGTIILCLLKTGLAGLLCGVIFKALKEKHPKLALFLSAAVVPLLNTILFVIGACLIYKDLYTPSEGGNVLLAVLATVISINFLIEIVSTILLSGPIYKRINFKRA